MGVFAQAFFEKACSQTYLKKAFRQAISQKVGDLGGRKKYGNRIKISGNGRNGFSGP